MLARTTWSSSVYGRHVSCSRRVQGRGKGGFSLAVGLKPRTEFRLSSTTLISHHLSYSLFEVYYENSAICNTNTLFYMTRHGQHLEQLQ
jgi:hypothetical protein